LERIALTTIFLDEPMIIERISIELTHPCNNACWFCYNHSQPAFNDMVSAQAVDGGESTWQIEHLCKQLAKHGEPS